MSIVYKAFFLASSLAIAYFIGTAGFHKVSPLLDKGTHEYLVDAAAKYWPGIFNPLFQPYGFTFDGDFLRQVVGYSEVLAAVGIVFSLLILPSWIGTLACVLLLPIMAGAYYLHYVTNTPADGALIVIGLLAFRLLLSIFKPSSAAGKIKAK